MVLSRRNLRSVEIVGFLIMDTRKTSVTLDFPYAPVPGHISFL
jgi:hypothetical protein